MICELYTPDQKVFEGEATGVKVPGTDGSFEMLNNHAAIISSLAKGTVRIKNGKEEQSFNIDSGIVEMLDNKVVILAESVL